MFGPEFLLWELLKLSDNTAENSNQEGSSCQVPPCRAEPLVFDNDLYKHTCLFTSWWKLVVEPLYTALAAVTRAGGVGQLSLLFLIPWQSCARTFVQPQVGFSPFP